MTVAAKNVKTLWYILTHFIRKKLINSEIYLADVNKGQLGGLEYRFK